MRDRVFGIENEYGTIVASKGGRFVAPSSYTVLLKNGRNLGICLQTRLWLLNGGCSYVDLGHPEYATPECRRVRDAVAHNKAGEEIIFRIFSRLLKTRRRNQLYKNNAARDAENPEKAASFGCHENYLVFGPLAPSLSMRPFLPLIPFLATRPIIDGAGSWFVPGKGAFALSQRAYFISRKVAQCAQEDSIHTQGGRGILQSEVGHHTGGESGMYRLHLSLGDANILETALFLKLGTTSLMLSMLEDGALPFLLLRDPVCSLHLLSESCDVAAKQLVVRIGKQKTSHAETWSALDVQAHYLEAAERYVGETTFESDESEDEARRVCRLWGEALAALARNDVSWMVGRLDYATKRWLAEREIERAARSCSEGITPDEIRDRIDLQYHALGPNTIQSRLREKWPEKRIVSDADILRATKNPPTDTRAFARGALVQTLMEKRPLAEHANIDWDNVTFYTLNMGGILYYPLSNPLLAPAGWHADVLNGVHGTSG